METRNTAHRPFFQGMPGMTEQTVTRYDVKMHPFSFLDDKTNSPNNSRTLQKDNACPQKDNGQPSGCPYSFKTRTYILSTLCTILTPTATLWHSSLHA